MQTVTELLHKNKAKKESQNGLYNGQEGKQAHTCPREHLGVPCLLNLAEQGWKARIAKWV